MVELRQNSSPARAKVRCAVYTRKSSEEGLEQEFNSLDAQREAWEAYVTSQKHEGWTVKSNRSASKGCSTGFDDSCRTTSLATSVQRLQDSGEQFAKVSGRLLLRLERPGDAGQRLLGDRARDGPNAALEMEMDRGRTDPQRLGELAQAEPVCADALDQLGGGGDDRSLRQAGAGLRPSVFP